MKKYFEGETQNNIQPVRGKIKSESQRSIYREVSLSRVERLRVY